MLVRIPTPSVKRAQKIFLKTLSKRCRRMILCVRNRPTIFALGIMLLSLTVIILFVRSGLTHDEDDRTTYICVDQKCVSKISFESLNTVDSLKYHSMESCRLSCGKNGNIWPLPTFAALGKDQVQIDLSHFKLIIDGSREVKKYLSSVFKIFHQNLLAECGQNIISPSNTSVDLTISVNDNQVKLDRNTNESYKLIVTQDPGRINITIYAETAFGARHAMETLSQLTSRVNTDNSCRIYIISADIEDRPAFNHRGLLIDTSRNFIPVKDLERTLGAMAANKLNVLHWHATDSHSFPLLLSKVPLLARLGAYSANETYTENDITHLVKYAKLRGVRILMEIDSPAHASNGWQFGNQAGLGNLVLCRNHHPWQDNCFQPPCGQLNPANPNVYKVLGLIFKNLQELMPTNDMFHMGGDEVAYSCWSWSSEIKDYMLSKGYPLDESGYIALWAEFHNRALKAWDNAIGHSNTKIILWTSDLTNPMKIANYLDKDRFIIEAWTGGSSSVPNSLLNLGYEVIFASVDAWYFDHGFTGDHYHTWKSVYDNKIPRVQNVLGGEAALWSEYVDSNNMDTRLWPRASALAERLWSDPNTPADHATYRLMETRNRLIRRGVKVDQILPKWCYLNEGRCQQ